MKHYIKSILFILIIFLISILLLSCDKKEEKISSPFGPKKIVPLFHPAVATYDVRKMELLLSHFQVFKPLCAAHELYSERIA